MNEQGYHYQLKPLLIPGLIFLVLYPAILIPLNLLLHFSMLQIQILEIIYGFTALGVFIVWIYAAGKEVKVEQGKITFLSWFGSTQLEPYEIRKIVLLWTPQNKQVAKIVTKKNSFYLSELYFAFPELMASVEQFVRENDIRSNFTEGRAENV